jgi:hypothetical protein
MDAVLQALTVHALAGRASLHSLEMYSSPASYLPLFRLRRLSICCADSAVLPWVAQVTSLESLFLHLVYKTYSLEFLARLPRLHTLVLDGECAVLPDLPTLQTLDLSGLVYGSAMFSEAFFLSFPQLRSLRVPSISDSQLMALTCLEQLEQLRVDDAAEITSVGLAHLSGLGELRRLVLDYCNPTWSDTDLRWFESMARLETLRLVQCPFSASGLRELWDSLPNFSELDCPEVLTKKLY